MRVRSRGVLKSRGARTIDVSIIADDDAREVDVSYNVSTRARRRLTDDLDDSKTPKLIIRYKDETRFMVVRFHKIENYRKNKCNRTSMHLGLNRFPPETTNKLFLTNRILNFPCSLETNRLFSTRESKNY